ncbi:radical SAM peptide maturase [Bacteroidia bacterium]|nr:radical SAM peptide maturase [Bacteroidia bacterium]
MNTNYTLFNTKDNYYLYNLYSKQFLLLPPLLFHLLKAQKEGKNTESKSNIENANAFSKEEIEYQYNKMQFLLKNAFVDNKEIKLHKYSAIDIEKSIANTRGITFEVTENCNLNCDYCIYGKYYVNQQTAKQKNLDFETAKQILDYLFPLWESSLNSSFDSKIMIGFYGGEALLNFKLIERIVSYIKTLNVYMKNRVEFSMTTNGVLLDKYTDFLVENNFNIKVSLDGGTEKENSYRKFHNGKVAFNKVYENVLHIRDKFPSYFEKYVNFISVMHNKNSESKVTDFFAKTLNKTALVSSLATDSLKPEIENEFWEMFRKTSLETENETIEQYENNIELYDIVKFVRFFGNFTKESYLSLLSDESQNTYYLPTGTCQPFKRMIFVTSDGKILPCERIGHQFEMGKITAEKVDIDFQKIAEKYNESYRKINEKCRKCMFQFGCGQCMFQINNFDCQDFTENSDENFAKFFSFYFGELERNPQLVLKSSTYKLI